MDTLTNQLVIKIINNIEQSVKDNIMKNLVSFPGVAQKKTVYPETVRDTRDFLILKEFEFSCPHCKSKSKFETNGMIFKRLQFYCGGCGTSHIVSNPALGKK